MRVLVIVVVIVTWKSKANSSSSLTELQTGTELGKNYLCKMNRILYDMRGPLTLVRLPL